jgi:pimeloyl-ACP methyl ester carboxylesterase
MDFLKAACDMFIRPPREEYTVEYLGPKQFELTRGRLFERVDLEVINDRGMRLQCSHWSPAASQRPMERLPCVVYLHGNCGNRVDALDALPLLLTLHCTVFTLDLSGSGLSEGEYISLGYYERADVAAVVRRLRTDRSVSRIALWGRSMGAATSVMYAAEHPDEISCLVLDSPFDSLTDLAQEIAQSADSKIPKTLYSGVVNLGLRVIRKNIRKKAQFDIRYVGGCVCVFVFSFLLCVCVCV